MLEICAPGSVSNGKYGGNPGRNQLGGVLGADNGLIIWEEEVVRLVEVVYVGLGGKIMGTVIEYVDIISSFVEPLVVET